MRKFLISTVLLASCVSFSSCIQTEKEAERPIRLIPEQGYELDFDEEIRQKSYRYFGDIFLTDKSTKEKLAIKKAYDVFSGGLTLEEFEYKYAKVIGGNVLGFRKIEENKYLIDVVMFISYEAEYSQYNLFTSDNDFRLEKLESEKLEFGEAVLVDSLSSDSGKYEARLVKNLIAVNFYSIENVEIPSFVGRYDLQLIEDGSEAKIIDYSFDPFSTNLPFELKRFSPEEKYLEYFEQGLGRLYNLYDLSEGIRTDLILPGLYEESFFYRNRLLVCNRGEMDIPASIVLHDGSNEWLADNFELLYESKDSTQLSCELDEDNAVLHFGEIGKINLDEEI